MKKTKLAAFLVLTGAGFYAQTQTAHALTYAEGDLLIGFRDTATSTTSGSDYLIDAGPISQFLNASSPFVLSVGATGTNLSSLFSTDTAGWFASGSATWGVVSYLPAGNGANVLYAGSPSTTPLIATSSTTQGGIGTNIDTVGSFFAVNGTSIGGAPATNQSAGTSGSWASQVAGGTPFGAFQPFEASIPASLNFYQIFPTSKSNSLGTPGQTLEGTFSIASNGNITYTPVAVPEPTALTALAGGAGLLGLIRRRRTVVA